MYTYEVWVRTAKYQGKSPLTYTSVQSLKPGTVVKVDLRKSTVYGIVRRESAPPKAVAMKPIDEVLYDGTVSLPRELLQLFSWMLQYYPAGSGPIAQLFLPPALPKSLPIHEQSHQADISTTSLPPLTTEQKSELKTMRNNPGSFLLHGDTGTGKTRIYTELIKDSLKQQKSALVLVPEIGLTPHLTNELKSVFGNRVVKVLHSGLTAAKRRDVWLEILCSIDPLIVVGPRSALFAPLNNIGVVIADECHDDGYKQNNTPHYHGLRIASQLARFHDAMLVFGSATPNVSDVYVAEHKNIPILRLTKPAKNSSLKAPKAMVIDKKSKADFSRSNILSNKLIKAIESQMQAKQQTLLFLNRRGSARVIMCGDCGWRALCPNCDLPLTLHEDSFELRCHTCGERQAAPSSCPECQNPEIVFYGPGTKAIEKETRKLFPHASVARFDGDNLTDETLHKNLPAIMDGSIDIIIGTQILIKGFDIPRLGLVALVDADTSLAFPDFSTEETTYQLIRQAIGRVGRGHVDGSVIVQTLQPDSNLLTQALENDWQTFYTNELNSRRLHGFPPFSFLLKLECTRKSQAAAIKATSNFKETLDGLDLPITLLGPTPAFKEKKGSSYSWQLILKSPRRSALLEVIKRLPSGWKYDIDPTHLL